jgi:23S rRNA pseudouridine2605 synthase
MALQRLQKILSQAGIASRRKAEDLIREGFVTVNGEVATLGSKADFTQDHIKVDGKLITKLENHTYLLFNKPKGVISMMSDTDGRTTLAEFLGNLNVRVHPVGRLDFNSDGLILLTNDGELVERIQKSDAFPRTYIVKIKGHMNEDYLARLERGARIENKFIKPHSVKVLDELNKKSQIEITFISAGNLDVKNYFETRGFLIEKITRTRYGHLSVSGIKPGTYKVVNKESFEALVSKPDLALKTTEALENKTEKQEKVRQDIWKDRARKFERKKPEERSDFEKTSLSSRKKTDDRGSKERGFRKERPFGERKFGDRKFSDRGPPRERKFGERKFGGRPSRGFGESRPPRERSFEGDRKFGKRERTFGERSEFRSERSSRPLRSGRPGILARVKRKER